MKRKLVKVGNSLAVTLPKELVDELNLKPGMDVDTSIDQRDGSFVVRAGVPLYDDGKVSPRFKNMMDKLVRERGELYKRLS